MPAGRLVLALVACVAACDLPSNGAMSRLAPDAVIADDDAPSISLDPNDIVIVGPSGVLSTTTAMVTGNVQLSGIDLSDPAIAGIAVIDPPCSPPGCAFAPPFALPRPLTVSCTPGPMPRTATVRVLGTLGASDMSSVTCMATAMNPELSVPSTLGPVSAQVGETAMAPLVVTNTGAVALQVSVAVAAGTTEWSASDCVAPASCLVQPGAPLAIPVAFAPTAHGERDSMLQVDTVPSTGTKFVALDGLGLGGVLRVDDPPAFTHSFGVIPRGQPATFTVRMSNLGNQPIDVTPSAVTAPFTVEPGAVTIAGNGGMGELDVTCQAAAAGGPFTATIDLATSPNVYQRNTSTVEVSCTIANTTAQITPTPVELGQHRVGDPAPTRAVTITNPPGGGPIMVNRIALAGAPDALELQPLGTPLPHALADGASLVATLELATTADVTLTDVTLEIDVTESETVTLALPVTGKVGTPLASVTPMRLALGTVCVNTPVTGEVTLTNAGTVTLAIERPLLPDAFDAAFTNPASYPEPPATVPLLEQDSAIATVMPRAADAPGVLAGDLVWVVDAPSSPFTIPISLTYVESGTAVSPEQLSFPLQLPNMRSQARAVTLENCGDTPVTVRFDGVRANAGNAAAWLLDPKADTRILEPDRTMRINVVFAPTDPGEHRAVLPIDVDGVVTNVDLEGHAEGTVIEKTSFYACTCSGGTPAQGWPLLLAFAFVLRRRRAA